MTSSDQQRFMEKTQAQISPEQFDLIASSLKEYIEAEDFRSVENVLAHLHPADIAQILSGFPLSEIYQYIPILESKNLLADVLVELPDVYIEGLVEGLSINKLATVAQELELDDSADLLQYMSEEQCAEVLKALPVEFKEEVEKLLTFEEDTAGALMTSQLFVLHDYLTVKEAIDDIRSRKDEIEGAYFLYVINQKRRFGGLC